MEICVKIGGIQFLFDSELELFIEKELAPFLCVVDAEHPVITVKVKCVQEKIPSIHAGKIGEDLLLEYYEDEEQLICLTKGGVNGYLAKTVCDAAFSELDCSIYRKHAESLGTIGNILRLIPMSMILQRKDILFFHAAQIESCGKGILFTAPSGTGKTTQAKLWRNYRKARIVCNDRTLVRAGKTYGYPVDGSEPVCSGEVLPLGAVVLLAQGEKNEIRRLTPREALKMLLPQLVIAVWEPMSRVLAVEQIAALMETAPVYFLSCVPEETAVQCLEQQLCIDGVTENA